MAAFCFGAQCLYPPLSLVLTRGALDWSAMGLVVAPITSAQSQKRTMRAVNRHRLEDMDQSGRKPESIFFLKIRCALSTKLEAR